jgi:hypothetical protein
MKKFFFLITIIAVVCLLLKKKKKQNGLPACIKQKIIAFAKKEKHGQPQNMVYYVTMPCCDFFNKLYNANCNLMGHPDGGITGKGDGKLPGFNIEKIKEKIIWKAE